MTVIVRNYTNDEAAIIMVDLISNGRYFTERKSKKTVQRYVWLARRCGFQCTGGKIGRYFPKEYSKDDIENIIINHNMRHLLSVCA